MLRCRVFLLVLPLDLGPRLADLSREGGPGRCRREKSRELHLAFVLLFNGVEGCVRHVAPFFPCRCVGDVRHRGDVSIFAQTGHEMRPLVFCCHGKGDPLPAAVGRLHGDGGVALLGVLDVLVARFLVEVLAVAAGPSAPVAVIAHLAIQTGGAVELGDVPPVSLLTWEGLWEQSTRAWAQMTSAAGLA